MLIHTNYTIINNITIIFLYLLFYNNILLFKELLILSFDLYVFYLYFTIIYYNM